jgi:hypothetical protein
LRINQLEKIIDEHNNRMAILLTVEKQFEGVVKELISLEKEVKRHSNCISYDVRHQHPRLDRMEVRLKYLEKIILNEKYDRNNK